MALAKGTITFNYYIPEGETQLENGYAGARTPEEAAALDERDVKTGALGYDDLSGLAIDDSVRISITIVKPEPKDPKTLSDTDE